MNSFICGSCQEYKLINNLAFTYPVVDGDTHETWGVCGDCAEALE